MSNELRLLVIGLDGATFDLIKPLILEGRLPVLARLMAEGTSGPLRSTIPPVSAPAWSTFMTGLNPGKHGIFQWRTYDPTKYTCLDEHLMTSSRLAQRTFWDVLGRNGYRVAAITVPMTYPVWPVNGFLMSGYPCPDTKRNHTYPPEWADKLSESYNFAADYYLHAPDEAIQRLGPEMLKKRTSLALQLIETERVQVCVVVLGEIDRAQHDLWKYTDPQFPNYHTVEGQRYRGSIAHHYEVSDAQVGRLLQHSGQDTLVVIMSDHGGGPHPPKLFQTNAWLRDMGWLVPGETRSEQLTLGLRRTLDLVRRHLPFEERLRRWLPAQVVDSARRLNMNIADIDWRKTRAYRFPMYHPAEGIEINLRSRQPNGIVEPGAEYDSLREQIMASLRQARDPETGAPIVREVYRSEELYHGPYLGIAPDVVAITSPHYKADSGLHEAAVVPSPLADLQKYSGLHTMDGVFIACGKDVQKGQTVSGMEIVDLAPTLLYAMDVPVPESMDGQVRSDVFRPLLAAERPVRYQTDAPQHPDDRKAAMSAEEEEQMLDKLRGLGYVE